MVDRNWVNNFRKRERARGERAFQSSEPFARWESGDWRRGWLDAQRKALPDRVTVVVDNEAITKLKFYTDAENEREKERLRDFLRNQARMEAARRGGGNRSGTTGGRRPR